MEISTLLVSSPDVCGGRLRIDGTRITINQIAALYRQGLDAEEIADRYPNVNLAQVYAALSCYLANKAEIDADLAREKHEAEGCGQDSENRLEALKELQRSLSLTPAKLAEWQRAIREARR